MVQSILDRRQGRLDPLGVGDGAGGLVLRDVEIDANQRALAFEGEIFDEQFGHDFLDSEWVLKKAGCGKKPAWNGMEAKQGQQRQGVWSGRTIRQQSPFDATALRKCKLREGVSDTQTKYPWRG
jgi:hypothetical protein